MKQYIMQYELLIEKGKEEAVISFLKSLDFVTIKKKEKEQSKGKTKKHFSYFGCLPGWDVEAVDLRKSKSRKSKLAW
jgi:hypothetical protein